MLNVALWNQTPKLPFNSYKKIWELNTTWILKMAPFWAATWLHMWTWESSIRLAAGCKENSFQSFTLCEGWEVICVVNPELGYKLTSLQGSSSGSMTHSREEELTRVKLFGEAAQRLMLVKFHSWITSLVFSSTLITLSLVMPSRRGTSLFLPFIFSWRRFKGTVRMFLLESKWSKKQRSGTRELHSHP